MRVSKNQNRKSATSDSDRDLLVARGRQLIDDAYMAGRQDAASAIMKIVAKLPARDTDVSRMKDLLSKTSNGKGLKKARAPRGTSRSLIERVLSTGAFTAKEIATQAKTTEEKLLTFSAIYLELVRGLKRRHYRRSGSKWRLFRA